ncbi:MAG: hypothetical protein L0H64_17115, partial [Pseudonocardia sp.]|nr:hypothetical protein [Pseudonocardia sp.]
MTDDVVGSLMRTARQLGEIADRLVDALPVVAGVIADVERDWVDERRREWTERASLVHRALLRELDAALASARAVGEELRVDSAAEDAGPPRAVPAGIGGASGGPASRAGLPRLGGPRLGDTHAERVDDERGVRIAHL